MKRVFEVKSWHVLVALVAAGVLVMGGVVLASDRGAMKTQSPPHSAAAADSVGAKFFKGGRIRMTASSLTSSVEVGSSSDTSVISASFRVPSGKKADVFAQFHGEAYNNASTAGGYCYGEFRLDGVGGDTFAPGEEWLVDNYLYGPGNYPTISMNGFKRRIGPGLHTVFFTMDQAGNADCFIYGRTLLLTANIHD